MYTCHCSNTFATKGKGETQLKLQGSSRCGATCLAGMEVWKQNNSVTVVFQRQHYGYEANIAHFLLSKNKRAAIAGKQSQGVTMQRILNDIRFYDNCGASYS